MENREDGFYWVQQCQGDNFEVAHWLNKQWWLTGLDGGYSDGELFSINETKLQEPK